MSKGLPKILFATKEGVGKEEYLNCSISAASLVDQGETKLIGKYALIETFEAGLEIKAKNFKRIVS